MKQLSLQEKAYDVLLAYNEAIVKMWNEGYRPEENEMLREILRQNNEMNTILQTLGSLQVFGWIE